MELFEQHQWQPLASLGIAHPFFSIASETIITTWIVLGILCCLLVFARIALRNPKSIAGHITLTYVRGFRAMIEQSIKYPQDRYVTFAVTLFSFLVLCNCSIIIPTLEEPTRDLNTTVALSLIAFWYIHRETLRAHGLLAYANEYFKTPLAVSGVYSQWSVGAILGTVLRIIANIIIGSLLLPIELLSKGAVILSLSFRLFGNIFGGSMIGALWSMVKSGSVAWQLVGLLSGFNLLLLLFFGIFEGVVQAVVFTVLTIAYLGMGTNPEEGTEHS